MEKKLTNSGPLRESADKHSISLPINPTGAMHPMCNGALHLRTQKMYWKRAPRGTSKSFMAFLHQRHQRFADALVLLILDNAQIHQSHLVKRFVQQNDWIGLEHLEPYCPEYNPIERFWKWLKAKVYGASTFDTIEDVIRKIRQVIWHDNEGWLISTIRFKFEPYVHVMREMNAKWPRTDNLTWHFCNRLYNLLQVC